MKKILCLTILLFLYDEKNTEKKEKGLMNVGTGWEL